MASFSQQLDAWTRQTSARVEAVFKTAVQDLATEMLTPVGKGGRLRVDTGFLLNSFSAAVNSIPRGESERPTGYRATDFDMMPITAAILSAKIGDRIVIGTAASYAVYREAQDGFLRIPVQNWQQIVDNAVRKVKSEYK